MTVRKFIRKPLVKSVLLTAIVTTFGSYVFLEENESDFRAVLAIQGFAAIAAVLIFFSSEAKKVKTGWSLAEMVFTAAFIVWVISSPVLIVFFYVANLLGI